MFPARNAAKAVIQSRSHRIRTNNKYLSPWRFSFQNRHHETILQMRCDLKNVFVVLVCNDDGAVVLTFEEFQQVAKSNGGAGQWISAARNRRQMYLIKGADGKLEFKIGKDEFAEKIFRTSQM